MMASKYKTAFPYDLNATPWNEADGIARSQETTDDLKRSLAKGDTVEEAAMFLQYWPKTVRAKMRELGLEERPRARKRRPIINAIEAIDGFEHRKRPH
jgi:hypothetical protein